jgi:hypothetical protein
LSGNFARGLWMMIDFNCGRKPFACDSDRSTCFSHLTQVARLIDNSTRFDRLVAAVGLAGFRHGCRNDVGPRRLDISGKMCGRR